MMPLSIFRMMRMEVAAEAAGQFGADAGSVKEVRHSANFVFQFTRDGRATYLRMAHESWRSRERVERELALMAYLAREDIPVVRAVATAHGEDIVAVPAPRGSFLAVALEAVPGDAIEPDELDEAGARKWGAAIARFHAATLRYVPPEGRTPRTWQDDFEDTRRWLLPDDAAHAELGRLRSWLEAAVARPDVVTGVIHHDFQPDNLKHDGDTLWAMDLDDAATYPLAADLAFALHEYRDSPEERRVDVRKALVDGYRTVRPVSDACVADIPDYIALRDLWHYAMIDAGHRDESDLPDWIAALRTRLRDRVGERLTW